MLTNSSRITQKSLEFNNFMLRQTIRFASGGPIIMAAEALLPRDWVDTWHSPGVQIPLMMSVVGSPLAVETGAEEVTTAMEGEIDTLVEINLESVVVRGGQSELPPAGEVFSGAVGKTIEDAAAFVPHGTIRSTTVGAIESNGGTEPELTRSGVLNPRHVNITEGPYEASTFSKPFPNPVPKVTYSLTQEVSIQMSDKLAIQYRDFYDVPRIFIVNHRGTLYLFDCPFDQDLDEYPDIYRVFVLPAESCSDLSGSWDDLASRATAYLGEVPVKSVQFDSTRRREIEIDVIAELERKLSTN